MKGLPALCLPGSDQFTFGTFYVLEERIPICVSLEVSLRGLPALFHVTAYEPLSAVTKEIVLFSINLNI